MTSEQEKDEWVKNYVNSQLKEFNDRWLETNTQLEQAQLEVDNLTKQKVHYETMIHILKTIKYSTNEAKEANPK
jgi:hypothetical protein